jgi:hypothetical protein
MNTLIVNGLVALIKQMEPPKRILPPLAVLAGIGVAYLYAGVSPETTLDGIVLALSAMGLHSGTKTMIKSNVDTLSEK